MPPSIDKSIDTNDLLTNIGDNIGALVGDGNTVVQNWFIKYWPILMAILICFIIKIFLKLFFKN